MKHLFLFFILAASPLCAKALEFPKDEAQIVKPATIKVLLEERASTLLIEANGAYRIYCPHTNVLISSSSFGKRDIVHVKPDGLVFGKLLPGTHAIRIVPIDAHTTVFVNGIQYKGCLELYDIGGSLRAINEVDVESYLRSCLATKFSDIQEAEVLNALAITERTYVYYLLEKNKQVPWHITATEAHYKGLGVTLQHLAMERAITETSHAILTYQKHPFAACYTEDSAGKTASLTAIFRKKMLSPRGVTFAGMEAERQKSSWSFQITKQELASLLDLPEISSMSLFTDKESGKVYAVKMSYAQGSKQLDFQKLQQALSAKKLKSNDFTVEETSHFFRFQGFGSGLGIGLCLHTADIMAKKGLDAKRILESCFADAQIEKCDRR